MGRREYSIDDKNIAKSGRHTVAGTLARNIISEIFWRGIPDSGTVTVDELPTPCQIGYYQVKVKAGYFSSMSYFVFAGKAKNGAILSDSECREIMNLPAQRFAAHGETYGERDGISKTKPPNELDTLIDPTDYTQRAASDTDDARREEIEAVRNQAYHRKQALSRDIEVLKGELRQMDNTLSHTASVAERVDAEKRKSTASRDLKSQEQSLFMDSMRLDVEAEEAVKRLTEQANLTVEVKRQFVINVEVAK